jgi:hypothetical protein
VSKRQRARAIQLLTMVTSIALGPLVVFAVADNRVVVTLLLVVLWITSVALMAGASMLLDELG